MKFVEIIIEKTDIGEYFGFELDGNKRFVLEDGTITHNSSLIGTLIRGKNDDGRGINRGYVMNFQHEKDTGQTSSIGYQLLGFRPDKSIITVENKNRKDSWPKIMQEACKIITFVDLAGHEKFLKTTIHGMSSNHPDYSVILVEGRGIKGMTREHIMLALSFGIPFVIIITKVDLYGSEIVSKTLDTVTKLVKNAKKCVWVIREEIDLKIPLQHPGGKYVPVFFVSNVTGYGLDLFKEYLFKLPKRLDYSGVINVPFEMSVIECFSVLGIGIVAHGFLVKGTARVGDVVWVGPDPNGKYHKTKIRTMQYKRLNVDFVLPGSHCTISLPGIDRNLLKQGVYVLHDKAPNKLAVRLFTAQVKILTSHPITIKLGYCPILNIDNIRMAAKVVKIENITEPDSNFLRGGGKADIQFKFLKPVYLRPMSTFVFREGKTRGYGHVKSIDIDF